MAKAEDLYIMRNTLLPGVYKVGRSSDVQKRALSLQASQPFRIVIVAVFPGAAFLEKAIHAALRQYKIKGGAGVEWFRCDLDTILHHVGQRLPAYFTKFVAEPGGHRVESCQAHLVPVAQLPAGSTRPSLSRDWVPSFDQPRTGSGLATDGSGSPRQIVPDGGELPVFGEFSIGVLAVGEEIAAESLYDLSSGEEASSDVFEGPELGSEVLDDFECLRYQGIGAS